MTADRDFAPDPNWTQRRDAMREKLRAAHEEASPLVMGILNVTPDSFSDGGHFDAPERALAHAARMVQEGADILDLGGESTRPGAAFVEAEEEIARTAPVIAALSAVSACPISIDTYKASVAHEAVRAGAVMINDIWGLQHDPDMARVAAETGALVVVMHNREQIEAEIDILDDLRRFFDRVIAQAERAGISRAHLALDPGIGFGKTDAQNLACIAHLDRLREYDMPVLLGLSRKSFLGRALGRDVEHRLGGTLGANIFGATRGAAILRVHDVAPHVDALKIVRLLRAA
ncbi:dihydropteroate synthase [Kozakia baliensis]|uniref:dihydropteroate synthase n=1 Tax=Kozakia baliensis TaxID=153496 RepID=UPI00345C07DA